MIKEVPTEKEAIDGEADKPVGSEEKEDQPKVLSGLNKFKSAFKRRINQTNKELLPTKPKKENVTEKKKKSA